MEGGRCGSDCALGVYDKACEALSPSVSSQSSTSTSVCGSTPDGAARPAHTRGQGQVRHGTTRASFFFLLKSFVRSELSF